MRRIPAEWSPGTAISGMHFPTTRGSVEIGDVEEIPLLKKIALTVTHSRMVTRNTYRLILYKVVLP